MKIHFTTFGCKVNQYETESLKELFIKKGYVTTPEKDNADIFIVNSCTVTASSDSKLLRYIRGLRHSYPDSVIVLTGCYPQASADKELNIPEVNLITGTKNRADLPRLLNLVIEKKDKLICVSDYDMSEKFENIKCASFENKTRAFIKIQDGCSQHCSYCIIPKTRGPVRSKSISDILSEASTFATNGHKEIVLTGINLGLYGTDISERLAGAAEACASVPGIERIRLGSLEPEMISDEDIKKLSEISKLCPHFHLSLQSGCDKILKAMNRRYTSAEYFLLIKKIRTYFPDCSVTTDIITGFPGETDKDFSTTVDFTKKIGFSKIHVFPYSRRYGTPAALLPYQIPENIKSERARILIDTAGKLSSNFMKSQIGKTYPVLFERDIPPHFHCGHTPNYIPVKIFAKNIKKSLRNMIFYVKIKEYEKNYCVGDIISE